MHVGGRFTIVELMIAVAIVSILAAIAVPSIEASVWKARRSEVQVNVPAITDAWIAYVAAHDNTIALGANPAFAGGKKLQSWVPGGNWSLVGWAPDGKVRGSYFVSQPVASWEVSGFCDVNENASYYWLVSLVDTKKLTFTVVEQCLNPPESLPACY